MKHYQTYLDELFIDELGFTMDASPLPTPDIAGSENIESIEKAYSAKGIDVIVVDCRDRIVEFQKKLINDQKRDFPNAHFLFISNNGKVFDLYNVSTSKKLKPITYDQIGKNTRLFKEKIQLFSADAAEGAVDLKIKIEKAFETNDKVTKKFFDHFKKLHDKLQKGITGIDDEGDKSWYASVLMNRLMFVYFLQKHKVIQADTAFLLNKFDEVKMKGNDYFLDFLLPLFFYGFAQRDTQSAKKAFVAEYGQVKYLNGGLFYPHHIEKKYGNFATNFPTQQALQDFPIHIDAQTLYEILTFLDGYSWYLDSRPLKDEKEINPDVLGYIFEKFINQKELGAYYTKEDITEYIAKNTIIPFILDKLKRKGYDAPDPNPLITNNQDIIGAMHSYIEGIDDYETLKYLYQEVLLPLSVLDPSVGSGAFLFAALNILLPIYQKTVFKLKTFRNKVQDKWLENLIQTLENHSEEYFLTKQIILNNLYGVDIVEEAVEICKLRLFLQLASHLPDIRAIEPLPDIDFNIYAGNSLVGGLSMPDLQGTYSLKLFDKEGNIIVQKTLQEQIENLGEQKKIYRNAQQLEEEEKEKADLFTTKNNIQFLENQINRNIDIGIDNPLHWFIDFAEVFEKGGFDVIIGNPPYVEYSKVKNYKVKGYKSLQSNNLYSFFIERVVSLLNENARWSFIVPLSISSAGKMKNLRTLVFDTSKNVWVSHYAWRPSKLFSGADMLLTIIVSEMGKEHSNLYSSKYHKWYSEERDKLFRDLTYILVPKNLINDKFPKIGSEILLSIIRKTEDNKKPISEYFLPYNNDDIFLYYFRAVQYWFKVLDYAPSLKINDVLSSTGEMKKVNFIDIETRNIIAAILSSTTFFINYIVYSSCQVVNSDDFLFKFDVQICSDYIKRELCRLGGELLESYMANSEIKIRIYKNSDKQEKEHFKIKKSKPIIDEIDRLLAVHYGFTDEETEFIINYDLKYRMGGEEEEE